METMCSLYSLYYFPKFLMMAYVTYRKDRYLCANTYNCHVISHDRPQECFVNIILAWLFDKGSSDGVGGGDVRLVLLQ